MDRTDSKIRAWQFSTAARSLVITYGIAAFGYFMLRPNDSGTPVPGIGMFVAGIVIQLMVWVANAWVNRQISDAELAAQTRYIIALVADAMTVLFFAIGTFRAIGNSAPLL